MLKVFLQLLLMMGAGTALDKEVTNKLNQFMAIVQTRDGFSVLVYYWVVKGHPKKARNKVGYKPKVVACG